MEQLVNFIIRPPRAEYDPEHDLLEKEFMMKGRWYQRKDLEVKNSRGDVLQCSHYMPVERPEGKPLPCVIYCHGNSGCRADGSEAAIVLLPSNITVFTLDFSGSGLSGGEHVTLGWNEKDDLKAVVEFLREDGNISLIGLWGRSMGAVTSLMYGAEDPSIGGMILDSPFSDLVDLMLELVDTYKFRLPKFTVKFAIQFMRRAIQKKAKFDITDLNTINVAKSSFVPVLFGHALDDDFIRPHHSDRIYEAYVGDKNIIKFDGDHNSPRPQFYFDSINIFFHNVLQPPEVVGPTFYDPLDDYFAKGSWGTMHDTNIPQSSVQKSVAASSIIDALNEVRMKRPMSRTDVPSNVTSNASLSETKEKENHDGRDSSSSPDMISFDLSNGDQYPHHLGMALEDDQYVEYHLEDIPSNAEEEERVSQRFQELFVQTRYKEAAEIAAESPQGILRSPDTVEKFRNVHVQAGQTPPLLQYFATLLTKGKLNAYESLELSSFVVNQNKKDLLENWLAEDKLECSEELGDLVKTVDNDLALKIYTKAGTTPKVVNAFAEKKEFDDIPIYSKQVAPAQHQVFINFRGEQLRNNFISHLVEALRRNKINVFIDYQELRGEDISILLKRIEDSRIAIVVFSSKYTESRWCLREAAKIKECVEQGMLKVLPIFYKVTTSNVKQLKGEFGDHFRDREWEYRFDKPRIERWKEALAFISGKLGLTFDEKSSESDFIGLIVKEVLRLLASIPSTSAQSLNS